MSHPSLIKRSNGATACVAAGHQMSLKLYQFDCHIAVLGKGNLDTA